MNLILIDLLISESAYNVVDQRGKSFERVPGSKYTFAATAKWQEDRWLLSKLQLVRPSS